MKTWEGLAKAKARNISLPSKKSRSALLLPGNECRCVKNMFTHKLLDNNSNITLIERNPEIFDTIAKQLGQMPTASYDLHECELHDFQPTRKYDYVFIDLLGTPYPKLVNWFMNVMMPQMTEGSDVVFNFNAHVRNGWFIKDVSNYCYDNYFREFYELENLIDEDNKWTKAFYALISFMMEGYSYKAEEPYTYQDTVKMATIVCRDLRCTEQKQPFCFQSLL